VLDGRDELLPARSAVLARFAALLTAQPWSIDPELRGQFAAQGLGAESIEVATGVVAMFNYLTRVADASGIEFDYDTPLPVFQPEHGRAAVARPDRESWPVITAEFRTLPGFPEMNKAWQLWHDHLLESDQPLTHRERRLLASAAAQECCDRWQADELADYSPRDDRESLLDAFARKLSRTPWQMRPADLQALRDAGYPELALLHAISVVALQNAESRLAMGRAMIG
jgi:hypothetical protein